MPFPLNLPMGFSQQDLNALLLVCFQEKVADVTIQSGDFIWARHNRTYVKISDRQMQESEVALVITWIYSGSAGPQLMAGNGLDFRATAMADRDDVKFFRGNAVSARVGKVDQGMQITLRSIPEHPPTLDQLGIEQELVKNLFPTYGLVLIVGTTGSGKSTLLGAANRWRLEKRRDTPVKIITFEDPIEYTYAGLADGFMPEPAQTEIGFGRHLTNFEMAGPNAMRRAADVIIMGEMRDKPSVEAGFEMAMTGHATYSTMHVDTPAQVVDRVVSFFPDDGQASAANKLLSNLKLVIAQKLARKVDGKVMAFRSWKIFDGETVKRLSGIHFSKWAEEIRGDCATAGTDFQSQVKKAFDDGLISFQVARDVAGLTISEAAELLNVKATEYA